MCNWALAQESFGSFSWRRFLSAYCWLVFWPCSVFEVSILWGILIFNRYVRKPMLPRVEETCRWLLSPSELGLKHRPCRKKAEILASCLLRKVEFTVEVERNVPGMPATAEFPCASVGEQMNPDWAADTKRELAADCSKMPPQRLLWWDLFLAEQGAGNKVENDFPRECL